MARPKAADGGRYAPREGPSLHYRLAVEVLPKALGLSHPTVQNSDGDEVVFHEVRFPLVPQTTPAVIADRLAAIASLNRENEAFWNWLADPASPQPAKRRGDAEKCRGLERDDGGWQDGARQHRDQGPRTHRQRQFGCVCFPLQT